jgi:hypothetical protein
MQFVKDYWWVVLLVWPAFTAFVTTVWRQHAETNSFVKWCVHSGLNVPGMIQTIVEFVAKRYGLTAPPAPAPQVPEVKAP